MLGGHESLDSQKKAEKAARASIKQARLLEGEGVDEATPLERACRDVVARTQWGVPPSPDAALHTGLPDAICDLINGSIELMGNDDFSPAVIDEQAYKPLYKAKVCVARARAAAAAAAATAAPPRGWIGGWRRPRLPRLRTRA